ncbi:MAG: hypothetical protein QS721_06285 [Candidatus Endonucleobacter sp. (ex Gigantidas childressi)]|nr:hypothetical protein [Candidatus Endonucleobacter sp. (ex Gigantidas childressi)]
MNNYFCRTLNLILRRVFAVLYPLPLKVGAALDHPNHLLFVGSWGFSHLSPTVTFSGNWCEVIREQASPF